MSHSSFRSVIAWFRAIGAHAIGEPATATDLDLAGRVGRYRAAVDALPAETRKIFLLHRADGLDITAIAERTGHPTRTIEQHIADAILAIWAELEGDQP